MEMYYVRIRKHIPFDVTTYEVEHFFNSKEALQHWLATSGKSLDPDEAEIIATGKAYWNRVGKLDSEYGL